MPPPADEPAAGRQPAASLLIDRSRSVGPGGAAVARDLARALVLALPPTLAFNAVFFDRVAEPLFPVPRSATLEALERPGGRGRAWAACATGPTCRWRCAGRPS